MSPRLFLHGPMLDPELRRIVAGDDLGAEPARLPDFALRGGRPGGHPELVAAPGESLAGVVFRSGPEAQARIDFHQAGLGNTLAEIRVETEAGPEGVAIHVPEAPSGQKEARWSLEDWQRDHGTLARRTAVEAMMLFGRIDGAALRAAMPTIRLREASRLRAEDEPMPARLRSPAHRDTVGIERRTIPYAGFFSIDETVLDHPRFDGGRSARLTRSALLSGDAVTVLPYDPVRDRVMLVEQFRFGPFARGDLRPWCLEPIAGRIDPGETPREAARRETLEEGGLRLDRLIRIGSYYPSPGALTEYIFSFAGLADLPDGTGGLGGVAAENEDIRAHVIAFDALMALLEAGEADSAPLWLSALWLSRARDAGRFA